MANDKHIIDYRTLRARKAYLGLRNEDLINATGCSSATVSAFLAGDERMKLESVVRLAAALGLKPRITFEPVSEQSNNVVELKIA